MLRLALLIAVVVLLPLVIRAIIGAGRREEADLASRRGPDGEDLVRDPACLTYVPRSAALSATVAGQSYFFCSAACAESFRRLKED